MATKKLPSRLRIAIAASGKTQREIAAAAGISEVHLSRIVNRRRHADDGTRAALARTLGESESSLFEDRELREAA